jgi:hypothetical protein
MPLAANAFSTTSVFCFTGSDSNRIDINVCSWALCKKTSSPLKRANLSVQRGEAFLTGKIFKLFLQDFGRACAFNLTSIQVEKLRKNSFIKIKN